MTEREEISQEITGKVSAQARSERERRKHGAYFWVVMVAYMVAGPAFAIWISSEGTQRSERKLCTIVVSADNAYRMNPPATDVGRRQAENFSKLRRDLGCPPYKEVRP